VKPIEMHKIAITILRLEIKANNLLEIQADVEKKKTRIASLEETCEQQKTELEKNKQIITEHLSAINNGSATNADLTQTNTQLKSQLEERTADVDSLRGQVTDIAESRDRLQKECATLTVSLPRFFSSFSFCFNFPSPHYAHSFCRVNFLNCEGQTKRSRLSSKLKWKLQKRYQRTWKQGRSALKTFKKSLKR
jgi:hypothetical protein